MTDDDPDPDTGTTRDPAAGDTPIGESPDIVETLRSRVRGPVIEPGDSGYEDARSG